MATITVSTSQNLTAVSYTSADTINITSGADLTIDSTPSVVPQSITCSTVGRLLINNASTTTPIVITFSVQLALQFTNFGQVVARGASIVIYTGDGTATQTVADFSTLFSGAIQYPSYVEVETASGSGVFIPWRVIPTVGTGFTQTFTTSQFGNGDLGKVLFYNHTTRVLTCGNGTNGAVIPNGATVRIPNIHIKGLANATIGSRSQTFGSPGGLFDLEWVGFSNTFYLAFASTANIRLHNVGCVGQITMTAGKAVDFDTVAQNVDPLQSTTDGMSLFTLLLELNSNQVFKNLYGTISGVTGNSFAISINGAQQAEIDNLNGYVIARTGATRPAIRLTQVNAVLPIESLTAIGGALDLNTLEGEELKTIRLSDTPTGTNISTNANDGMTFANIIDCAIHDIRLTTPGSSFRNNLVTPGALDYRVVIYDVDIDCQSNGNALTNDAGQRHTYANINLINTRSFPIQVATGIGAIYRNITHNGASTGNLLAYDSFIEGLQAANIASSGSDYPDAAPFTTLTNVPKTTGALVIGPFNREITRDLYDLSGSAASNPSGSMALPASGDIAVIKATWPIRGITSFQNTAPTVTAASGTGITYEFRVANWEVTSARTWSSWATLDGTNLSGALAALSGYDSDIGFDMQVRLTTTTAVAARTVSRIVLATNYDSGFSPLVADLDVDIIGAVNGTVYGLFDNTNPAAPVLVDVATAGSDGLASASIPYAFDNTTQDVLVRVRKLGYFSKDIATDHTLVPLIIPAAQLESVVDVSGGASVTGVAINHTTGTITVTANRTIAEVYAYVQYDLASIANIDKENFLETTDGENYVMTYDLTVSGAVALTGTANVSMPANTFTLSGGATTTLVVTDVNGTNGFIVLTGLSSHAVYVKDNGGTQKLYSSSVTGSSTVYIPTGSSGSWTYVIKRAGYAHQVGTINAATGGTFTITASTPEKLNADGTDMYLGTTSALARVVFDGITFAYIDIGDGVAVLQASFDETEDALITNDGMIWLGSGKSDVSQFNSGGGDFLFLSNGWRLRRWNAGDDNATIQAFVQSVDGTPVDGSNGPVAFLSSDTPATIAAAVFAYDVDEGLTYAESVRGQNAALFGDSDGANTDTTVFKSPGDNTRERLTANTPEGGDRTITTMDLAI